MKNNLLIFGYGYTASAFASSLNLDKWSIFGTSRSKKQDNYCKVINYNQSEIKQVLEKTTHILVSIPPNEHGDIVLQKFQDLIKIYTNIKWIGYLSSTGVYGNHNADWVDENTETNPSSERGIRRILAENQWTDFGKKNNFAINIFRLSGIYGPKRNALMQLEAEKARSIYKPKQVFSRIHVEDISNIIKASINHPSKLEIYNLADDYPCSTIEVNNFAARLLNIEPPQIINYKSSKLSAMAKEFYSDNRRVSNTKIKNELNITLQYPSYKEGILKLFKDKQQLNNT